MRSRAKTITLDNQYTLQRSSPDEQRVPVPHNVLVVDDDSAVRQLVEEYLGQNDFLVTGAATGTEFLDTCRTGVDDLVLLDLRLRGEDGMQLLRQLRAESHIPVIILTGRAEEG